MKKITVDKNLKYQECVNALKNKCEDVFRYFFFENKYLIEIEIQQK